MTLDIWARYERSVWAIQQAAARLRLLEKALRDDDLNLVAARVSDWADEAEAMVAELTVPDGAA